MGKIRVAALGSDEEKELKEKQRVKREEKKKREGAEKIHIAGMKGGERIKSVGSSEEDIDKFAKLAAEVEKSPEVAAEVKEKKKKKQGSRSRSQRYQAALMQVDRTKTYAVADALVLLRKVTLTKFAGSVELHINTIEKGLRGTVQLPHGTGKEVRVAVVTPDNVEAIVAKVEAGAIDFDALVAHPGAMPKLAKVARYLGPRGLMPNPKNGTISPTPEKVAAKLKGGEVNWKTESEFPIIHQVVGKLSFTDKEIAANITALLAAVGASKMKNATLKSTMSPGVRIAL